MIATTAAPTRTDTSATGNINWPVTAIFALVWVELIWRLQMEWSVNPQYGYGWTVPFLAGYLLWRRRTSAPAAEAPNGSALAACLLVLAALVLVPIRVIQEANPDWRLLSWGMAMAAVAVTFAGVYLAGGSKWLRYFAFPILFFLVAVPWPTQLEQLIIQGLMRADAAINVEVLSAIGVPAVQLGNVIEVGTGFVGIDEACTGVRSLQATLMVSLFLGELYDFTLFRRIALVATGAFLAFFCNLVRTFLLVYMGAEHGSEMIKRWHDPAGYSILTACLLGLWGMSVLFRRNEKARPQQVASTSRGFAIPRLALALLLTFTLVAEAGTHLWYGMHEARAAKVTPWSVQWPSTAPSFKPVPVAEQAQELLRYNEGGGGMWKSEDGHLWNMYFFKWLPGRTAGLFIKNHRPDICLPASGMTQRGDVQHKLVTVNGIALPIRAYVFENGGQQLHVYYCYWDGTTPDPTKVNEENWTARGRIQNVLQGKRDVGTQMLEIVALGYDDDAAAEQAVREQLARIVRPS
jgi:exosortase